MHGLSPDQLDTYRADGVVRVPDAVASADVESLAEVVWRRLRTRHGIHRDRPASWTTGHPAQLTSNTDELAQMASPRIRAVIDQLLGAGAWKEPPRWGLPLVTLPGFSSAWDVPTSNWHIDIQASAEAPRVARVFVLLTDIEPGGGATGFVTGSHRLARDVAREAGRTLNSGDTRKAMISREPWFAGLLKRRPGEDRVARYTATGAYRVGEMTGRAGDAWFMDPHMLHATTPNAATTPRMMLTEWVYGRDTTAGPG